MATRKYSYIFGVTFSLFTLLRSTKMGHGTRVIVTRCPAICVNHPAFEFTFEIYFIYV